MSAIELVTKSQLETLTGRVSSLEVGSGVAVTLAPTLIGHTSGMYFNGGDLSPTIPEEAGAGDLLVVMASYHGGAPGLTLTDNSIIEGGTLTWTGIHQPNTVQYIMHAIHDGSPSLGDLPDPGWSNILNWSVFAFRGTESPHVQVLHHGIRGYNADLNVEMGSFLLATQTFFDTAGGWDFTPTDWTLVDNGTGYGAQYHALKRYILPDDSLVELVTSTPNPNGYDHISILRVVGVTRALRDVVAEDHTLGTGGVGGIREQQSSYTYLPPYLEDAEEILVEWRTYPSVRILQITTPVPMRVRLYGTEADALADQSRPPSTFPPTGAGCFLDQQTLTGQLTIHLGPQPTASNLDDPVANKLYLLIQNLSGTAQNCWVNFTLLPEERKV